MRNRFLAFVFLFTITRLGCVLWSWDAELAPIPALAYSSGLGANLCVSCLYSQACLHTLFHLGLFWRPVKTQASRTNSVCEKNTHACLITTGHSLPRVLSKDPLFWEGVGGGWGGSLRPRIIVLKYGKKEKKKVLIFKVLAAIPSHTRTYVHTHPQLNPVLIRDWRWGVLLCIVLMRESLKHSNASVLSNPGGKINLFHFCRRLSSRFYTAHLCNNKRLERDVIVQLLCTFYSKMIKH